MNYHLLPCMPHFGTLLLEISCVENPVYGRVSQERVCELESLYGSHRRKLGFSLRAGLSKQRDGSGRPPSTWQG